MLTGQPAGGAGATGSQRLDPLTAAFSPGPSLSQNSLVRHQYHTSMEKITRKLIENKLCWETGPALPGTGREGAAGERGDSAKLWTLQWRCRKKPIGVCLVTTDGSSEAYVSKGEGVYARIKSTRTAAAHLRRAFKCGGERWCLGLEQEGKKLMGLGALRLVGWPRGRPLLGCPMLAVVGFAPAALVGRGQQAT